MQMGGHLAVERRIYELGTWNLFVSEHLAPEFAGSVASFSLQQFEDIFRSIVFVWSRIGILHCPFDHQNWSLDLGEMPLFST